MQGNLYRDFPFGRYVGRSLDMLVFRLVVGGLIVGRVSRYIDM